MRSVPDWCSDDVRTASCPARSTTAAISRASVATTRRSHTPSSATRRTTQRMRGSPANGRRGFFGRRLEPSRAGITPRIGTEEDTKVVPRSLDGRLYHLQEVLQQPLTHVGADGLGMELDAVDGFAAMLDGHDLGTPGLIGAPGGEHEIVGERAGLDHE